MYLLRGRPAVPVDSCTTEGAPEVFCPFIPRELPLVEVLPHLPEPVPVLLLELPNPYFILDQPCCRDGERSCRRRTVSSVEGETVHKSFQEEERSNLRVHL